MANVGHETSEMFPAVAQFLPPKAGFDKTSIYGTADVNSIYSVQERDKAVGCLEHNHRSIYLFNGNLSFPTF